MPRPFRRREWPRDDPPEAGNAALPGWSLQTKSDKSRDVSKLSVRVERACTAYMWRQQIGRDSMRGRISTAVLAGAALVVGSGLHAQQPAAPNLDTIPDKMPFSTPYGAPIGAQQAQALIEAAAAEAT